MIAPKAPCSARSPWFGPEPRTDGGGGTGGGNAHSESRVHSQGCVSAYFPRARLGGGPLGAYINASLPVAESSSDAYHTHPQVFAESHDVNNACCKPGRA